MGQYYFPTILRSEDNLKKAYDEGEVMERNEFNPLITLCSHDFKCYYKRYDGRRCKIGIGLKLMEHSYIGNPLVRAMEYLLANDYAGCPVVWAGDYADELFKDTDGKPTTLYAIGHQILDSSYKKLPPRRVYNRYHKYLINHDTHEYVKLPKYSSKEWQIHPLPLLTAESNGRGGGDARSLDPRIGMWRGHHLSVSNDKPLGYTLIDGTFTEDD